MKFLFFIFVILTLCSVVMSVIDDGFSLKDQLDDRRMVDADVNGFQRIVKRQTNQRRFYK